MKFGYLGENDLDLNNISNSFKNFLEKHSGIEHEEIEKINLDNIGEDEYIDIKESLISSLNQLNISNLNNKELNNLVKRFLRFNKKSSEIEENILKDIQESVLNFLSNEINNLPDNIKNTIISLKDELGEGEIKLEDIKIEQFVVRYLGEEHRQVNFVLNIGDITKSVSTIINNETKKVVNLTISEKDSRVIGKKLDDRDCQNILVRGKNRQNFQKNPEKEGIDIDSVIEKDIFNEIVINTWNKIFLKNKEELENLKLNSDLGDKEKEDKKKEIIEENAQAIADIFAGILQGTVDFTHSTYEYIKDYFIHFLEKGPNLEGTPEITNIKEIEDGVLVANGTYEFELDSQEGERIILPANFTFIFERGRNGNWTIAGLHSYTD